MEIKIIISQDVEKAQKELNEFLTKNSGLHIISIRAEIENDCIIDHLKIKDPIYPVKCVKIIIIHELPNRILPGLPLKSR